jgi:hypothetical protein
VRGLRWLTLGSLVAAGAVTAAIAGAQQPAPTVAVTASPTSVAVASGSVAAGPTRFEVTRQGNKNVAVYFFLLLPGTSVEDFQASIARDDRTGGEATLGLVSIQASVTVAANEASRGFTFTLKPNVQYVVLSEAEEEGGGNRVPQRGITTFTTGAASGATAAAPDATVRMRGLRFRGARTLPRRGVVRFTNEDGVPHFALAFPLRPGVSSARFGRVVRSNNERAFGRISAGAPVGLQNIISGGNTANDQDVRFTRAGRYGLVCFFGDHHRLGMYRVVRVR